MKPLIVLVLLGLVTFVAAHEKHQHRPISRGSRQKKPYRPSKPWDGKGSASVTKEYEHTVEVKGGRYNSRQTKPRPHKYAGPKRQKKKPSYIGQPRMIHKQHTQTQRLPTAVIKISQIVTGPARKGMSKVQSRSQTYGPARKGMSKPHGPLQTPVSQFDLELRNFDDNNHMQRDWGGSHTKAHQSHMHTKARASSPGSMSSSSSRHAITYPDMPSRNFDSRMNNYDSMWGGSTSFNGDSVRGNQVPMHNMNNWNGDNSRWEHNNDGQSWDRFPSYNVYYDDRSNSGGTRSWDTNRNYNNNEDWSVRRWARMNNNNEPLDWRTVRWNRNDNYYDNIDNNNNGNGYYFGQWDSTGTSTGRGISGTGRGLSGTGRGISGSGQGRREATGGSGDWYGRNSNRNDNNGWDTYYNYNGNENGRASSSSRSGRRSNLRTGRRLGSRSGYYYDLDNGNGLNDWNDWNNNGNNYYGLVVAPGGRNDGGNGMDGMYGNFWERNNDGNNLNNDNGRTYRYQQNWDRNEENRRRPWYGLNWDRNNDGNNYDGRRWYGVDRNRNRDNYEYSDRRRWYGLNGDRNGNSIGRRRWYGFNTDRNGDSLGRRSWYGLNRDSNGDNNGRQRWYGLYGDRNSDGIGRRNWYRRNNDRYNDNIGSSRITGWYGPRRSTTIDNGRTSRYRLEPNGNYDNGYNSWYTYPPFGTRSGRRSYGTRRSRNNSYRGDRTFLSGTRRGNTDATGKRSGSTTHRRGKDKSDRSQGNMHARRKESLYRSRNRG